MNTALTVISSILVFGFLIFIHEFGHYIFARIFNVKIDEFSIGMGPRLFWYDSKKTGIKYSVAMLPIGGFVSMPGENGENDEYADIPNTFGKKPAWQRFIITAAGAAINIIVGFIFMIILMSVTKINNDPAYVGGDTTVREFHDKVEYEYSVSSSESGLQVGDEIIAVGKKRVRILDELSYEIMRQGNKPVDVTVVRNGEVKVLPDVVFPMSEMQDQTFGLMDFKVSKVEKTFGTVMKYSWFNGTLIIRMVWESLFDLITGRYTFAAVSGPVGISSAIGDAAAAGFASLLYITVLISINLGVMNLLPIPALDGGRLLPLLIEMVTRKKLPPKVEGIINATGLILLLGLSLVVMIKDVIQLIV